MDFIHEFSSPTIIYHHTTTDQPHPESFAKHCHTTYEILYVVRGGGKYVTEGREYPLLPGTLLFQRPYEFHYVQPDTDKPYERYALHFDYSVSRLDAGFMASPQGTSVGGNYHRDILNAWTPENTKSNIPRLQYGDEYSVAMSDRFLMDASYLNVQNITVGYTLPQNITRKFLVSKLRIYVVCDNVGYVSRRKGLDPRQSFTGGTNNAMYSPIRTVSGGINITF